jgi:hypothetical protein
VRRLRWREIKTFHSIPSTSKMQRHDTGSWNSSEGSRSMKAKCRSHNLHTDISKASQLLRRYPLMQDCARILQQLSELMQPLVHHTIIMPQLCWKLRKMPRHCTINGTSRPSTTPRATTESPHGVGTKLERAILQEPCVRLL